VQATLIYDSGCAFCTRTAHRMQAWAGSQRLAILAYDAPGAMDLHPDLSFQRSLESVQLVRTDGRLSQGAEAAVWAIGLRPGFGWLPWVQAFSGIRQISEMTYRFIARRRRRCPECGKT
jgi:predicted DCC family thiol-disulfide oxidoreductase YuxK